MRARWALFCLIIILFATLSLSAAELAAVRSSKFDAAPADLEKKLKAVYESLKWDAKPEEQTCDNDRGGMSCVTAIFDTMVTSFGTAKPPKTTKVEILVGYKTWDSKQVWNAIAVVMAAYDSIKEFDFSDRIKTLGGCVEKLQNCSVTGADADYRLDVRHRMMGNNAVDLPIIVVTPRS